MVQSREASRKKCGIVSFFTEKRRQYNRNILRYGQYKLGNWNFGTEKESQWHDFCLTLYEEQTPLGYSLEEKNLPQQAKAPVSI